MKKIPKKEEQVEWNDAMYAKFPTKRAYTHPNPLVGFIEWHRLNKAVELGEIDENKKVIEVGCEGGFLLKSIIERKKPKLLVGLDISRKALIDARDLLNINNRNVCLIQGDNANLPFKSNGFEVVICSEVLEHVIDPENAVKELHRIVKEKGVVIITVPYEKMLTFIKHCLKKVGVYKILFSNLEETTSEWHIHSFTPKTLKELLVKFFTINKFKIIPFPVIGPKILCLCKKGGDIK